MPSSQSILEARPTLVVVDLQEEPLTETGWFGGLPDIVRTYSANAERIIRRNAGQWHQIVFAEIRGGGPTMPRFIAAAGGAAARITLQKQKEDLLDPADPDIARIRSILGPLSGSRTPVEVIGINAGACVADSAWWLLKLGCRVRVRAEGILNHYVASPLTEIEYRRYNDLDEIKLAAYPEPPDTTILDVSELAGATNLVDFHLAAHDR